MRLKLVALLVITAILLGSASQAQAGISVDFNIFIGGLSPYGSWVTVPDYGEVWYPDSSYTGDNWRPYMDGQWVWTDYGWCWVSDEPWGWATYHYGRWVYLDNYGWCWVPGAVWAPAWVAWYVGPGYIGWVPLSPYNYGGFRVSFCVFVPIGSFLSVNVGSFAVPQQQNVTIINNTTNISNNNVVNPGPSVAAVERATGTRIQRVNLIDRSTQMPRPGTLAGTTQLHGSNLYVYRPTVAPNRDHSTPLLRTEAQQGTVEAIRRQVTVNPRSTAAPSQQQRQEPRNQQNDREKNKQHDSGH